MDTPLSASSTPAGSLMGATQFHVPQFQREYAWTTDEVEEFFNDLHRSLSEESYFLGLIILTGAGPRKDVVDGQQRLLTLTLLASAIYHQAMKYDRKVLADRLRSTFLRSMDFASDEESPRISLSGAADEATLAEILEHPADELAGADEGASVSALLTAYKKLTDLLEKDLSPDPFKHLGMWADFITNRLYMAVFVHPEPGSAYEVFEVVNTRGKELTTADLLKNYILSQTSGKLKSKRYDEWQELSSRFSSEQQSQFVQFIRHAVTTIKGHVLPRDLYDVLAGRPPSAASPMSPDELMELLRRCLPPYVQMMDPTSAGPADEEQLAIFSVLNRLNVIAVRPILLSILDTPEASEGMRELLKLVARRVVAGNLGTGNVERRFGVTAQRIRSKGDWREALEQLSDLNPPIEDFKGQVHRRSLNQNVLSVIRQSILQQSITPEPKGNIFLIRPRGVEWPNTAPDMASYWVSTIGNSFLATLTRRPSSSASWAGFREKLLPEAVPGEWVDELARFSEWTVDAVDEMGKRLADVAADVWY